MAFILSVVIVKNAVAGTGASAGRPVVRCPHPLVSSGWLMSRLFARDLELSCDEQALSAYGSSMQGRFSCSHKIKRKSRCFAVDFLKIRPKKGWSLL